MSERRMSRLSQESAPPPCPARLRESRGGLSLWVCLVIVAVIFGAFCYAVASWHRANHCIYIMGHWIHIVGTPNPLFCQ